MKPGLFPGLHYRRVDRGPLRSAAEELEYEIFSACGYAGPGPKIREYETCPSVFYVAVSEDEGVVGIVRKVTPGPSCLPTLKGFELDASNQTLVDALARPSLCEDIATTVIRKGFRARKNFACVLNLWRLAFQDAVASGARHWFAAAEPLVLHHYKNTFHFAFEELGPPQDYLGAACLPCVLDLAKAVEHLSAMDSELASWLCEGLDSRCPMPVRVTSARTS